MNKYDILRYWYQKGTYIWKRKIYLGFARM